MLPRLVHGGGVTRRKLLTWVVALLMTGACTRSSEPASLSSAVASGPTLRPSTPGPSEAAPSVPVLSNNRISLRFHEGASFLARAKYPLGGSKCKHAHATRIKARYPGALSVRSSEGLLSMTVTLPFERYLEGIAEVPPTWPAAALEAQVIAARTYALAQIGFTGAQGVDVRKPICASTDCQVYGGIPEPPPPAIQRWIAAVRRTQGRVLLHGGRPADTLYFSTSNGHTYGNDQVFGSAPLPYLRPVVEHDDGASPLSQYRVKLPFHDLAMFLAAGGLWPSGTRISSVLRLGSRVQVAGPSTSTTIDAGSFRDAVNTWAPCLIPGRYPTGQLPATIPSVWYDVGSGSSGATVAGRGWGHGVGMVQWGAYGKAKRGWSADRILAYYYSGLTPTSHAEPGLIRVNVATGLRSLVIQAPASGATINDEPLAAKATVHLTGSGGTVTASP
jgi:SpoIID/LytB domain protein